MKKFPTDDKTPTDEFQFGLFQSVDKILEKCNSRIFGYWDLKFVCYLGFVVWNFIRWFVSIRWKKIFAFHQGRY